MRLYFTTLIVVILAISFVEAGKANGKKCFKSKKCNSGHCCKIPGKIFKQCQECCGSQDCSGGKVCSGFNCVLPTAVGSKKPNGGKCTNGSECNSGHCCGRVWPFKGRCRECCKNSHCDTGKCKNRVCLKDVSEGERCAYKDAVCADSLKCCKEGFFGIVSRCRECCIDGHCNNPNIPWCDRQVKKCTSNAPRGGPCTNNGCQSGLKCCPGSKRCYQCCNNNPFNAYACKYPLFEYCIAGICMKKQKSGSFCFQHYECVSNQCKNFTCL